MLVRGYGHSNTRDAVPLGTATYGATPTPADVEDSRAGSELQFPGHQIPLVFLGLVERFGMTPAGAAVDHALVEHPAIQFPAVLAVTLAPAQGRFVAPGLINRACIA